MGVSILTAAKLMGRVGGLRRRRLIPIAALNYFPISRLLKLMKNQGIPVTCSSEALAGPLEDVSSDGVTCWIVM